MARAASTVPAFDLSGQGGTYRLSGAAVYGNARRLLEAGRRAFGREAAIDLDLSGLESLDSAGLAVLISWLGDARGAGRSMACRGLPGSLVPMARVAGVEALLGATR